MAREARETFLRVLHLRPATARDLHHLAVACFQAGDRARGMEASREALRLDPQMTAPMHNLAVACMHEGQWRRARYWVRQAMAVDPDDVSLRRLRMKLLLHALAGVAVESWRVVARRR
jgi:Flp pilus assembly protein TadD